jgi:nitrous oxidase accessory protein NosD
MKRKIVLPAAAMALLLACFNMPAALALDHTGALGANETWSPADNPHNITGTVTVPAGIKLTILPGTQVFFSGFYSILVEGEMAAGGTIADPVLFTRDASTAYWNNLQFQTNGKGSLTYSRIEYAYSGITLITNSACTIDHSAIQSAYYGIYWHLPASNPGHVITNNLIRNCKAYGTYVSNVAGAVIGAGNQIVDNQAGTYFTSCSSPKVEAGNTIARNFLYGVQFQNCSQPALLSGVHESGVGAIYNACTGVGTIANLSFLKNKEAAIQMQGCGTFSLGSGNAISDNGWPLAIDAGSFPDAASQIPTTGNLVNSIRVGPGSGSLAGTWPKFAGLDYWLSGITTIAASGDLTIAPGNTLKCEAGASIHVSGKLSMPGTAQAPIRLTRIAADYWNGLQLLSGSQAVVQHVKIEYAYYGLYQNESASAPISKSSFAHCTYGVYVGPGASGQISGSEFFYNEYGVYLAPGATATIGGSGENFCCFKGNRIWAIQNENASAIKAEFNYWGDPAGPNHMSNPDGRGDRINDSVDFLPFSWACANICECDLNRSGGCNILDYQILIQDWGRADCPK